MGGRLTGALDRLSHGMRKRTFLIRLLTTTLLAAFIPLTIMALQLIHRESQHVHQSAQAQLENVTAAAAGQFDAFIDGMTRVNIKLLLSAKLHENIIGASVQSQMEAVEVLRYYSAAIPFVRDCALYLRDTGEAYTANGKMQTNGFCLYTLLLSQEAFLEHLDARSDAAGFIPWTENSGGMIYIAPIRPGGKKAASRYGVYLITPATLSEALGTVLAGQYFVSSIDAPDGTPVYRSGAVDEAALDDPNGPWIADRCAGAHGYTLRVYADKTAFHQNVESLTANARLLSLMNIALCLMLILMVVLLNYRPLARVVRRVRGENAIEPAPELDAILSSYTQLADEQGKLTWQLYEKTMMIADRVMENLLSGRKVQPGDLRLLKLNMPGYRVVCAPLNQIQDSAAIIERNAIGAPIYAIEMYADNRLSFICGCAEDSPATLRALADALRRLIRSDEIPLGYSSVCDSPERLFMAYLEAGKALTLESDSPDRLPVGLSGQQMYIMDENPQDVEDLAYAIKSGDPEMIAFAERAFDGIQAHSASRSAQRYACYQVIDLYRRLGSAVGLELDMEQLSQALQESSIAVLRERFLEILARARETRLRDLTQTADLTYSNLMQYINDHFADPMFSMNEVADHLGVSIYTASCMLKTLTGINFRKYLNDMRIENARDLLLTTDLSVNEVAARAGFTSPSYFISIFKKAENTTPSNFRKQHDEEE